MKKALAILFIISFLVSMVAELQTLQFASANFFPENPPPGIQITAEGTIQGTTLIQRSGKTYTLTANIESTIVILCDGIVLDGAGFTLEGSGSGVGIFLQARKDVTIKNMKISNFVYGIKSTWLYYGSNQAQSGNTFSDNTLTNNTYGIHINDFSKGNNLMANTLLKNTYGIYLESCANNILRGNRMSTNDFNFFVGGGTTSESTNDVDQSNTVNGEPVVYWVNQQGKTVPDNAGYVALVSCTNMTVKNLNLAHNGQGMLLAGVTDSIITDNKIAKNKNGVWLVESQNNQIEQNTVTDNNYEAFYVSSSNNNRITENTFVGNGLNGTQMAEVSGLFGRGAFRLFRSSNNYIASNEIIGNGEGINLQDSNSNTISANSLKDNEGSAIHLFMSKSNTIANNIINGNIDCGVKIWDSNKNTVSENQISNNGLGILLDDAGENNILQNDIADNKGFGMQLKSPSARLGGSENNVIHHNNFINNQPDGLDVSIPAVMGEPQRDIHDMEWLAGLGNAWDDGREGNYWSDYLTRFPNASEIANTGVGNTPYYINENNVDRHPLMSPFPISVDIPFSSSSSPSQEPTAKPAIETQTETEFFGTLQVIVASVIIFILVSAGWLVYYKKRSAKGQETLTKTLLVFKQPKAKQESELRKDWDVMKRKGLALSLILALLFSAVAGTLLVKMAFANPVVPGAFWGIPNPPRVTIASPKNMTVLTSNTVDVSFAVPALTQFTYENVTAQITIIHYRVESRNASGGWSRYLEGDVTPKTGYSDMMLSLPEGNFSVTVNATWAGSYQSTGMAGYAEGFSVEDSSTVYFAINTGPPNITILSPLSKNYSTTDIPLNFAVNEPVSETAYSLDGQANMSLVGNITVKGFSAGTHSLIVYATDLGGNAVSKAVQFSVDQETKPSGPVRQPSESFPTTLVTASIVSVAIIGLGLLVYFKKRRQVVECV